MIFTSILFLLPFLAFSQYEGHKVVRFKLENRHQQAILDSLSNNGTLRLAIWKKLYNHQIDLKIPPDSFEYVMHVMAEVQSNILIENVQKLIDNESAYSLKVSQSLMKRDGSTTLTENEIFADYHDTDDLMKFLISRQGATEFTIGKTFLGEPIRGVKFGAGPKTVVVNGGIHAREWISPATTTYIANALMSNDTRAAILRDQFTFHFIPVLNPDGYAYSRAKNGDRLWRKNRTPNNGSFCMGTDINRNFEFKWSQPGASNDPCDETFYGENAMDTNEAKALDLYISSLKNVVSYFDIHSYSQMWLYPWGFTCDAKAPDENEMFESSKVGVEALRKVYGTPYTFGGACDTIYQSSGSTDDHFYALHGIKYSMTVELRDTGDSGFLLPASQIIPVGKETVEGFFAYWAYVETNTPKNSSNDPIVYAEPHFPTNYLLIIAIVAVALVVTLIGVLAYIKKQSYDQRRVIASK